MPSKRLWDLLARKYNNELSPEEQRELDELIRQHQDVFELNEAFARLRELQVRKLSSDADEERSRRTIAGRIAGGTAGSAGRASGATDANGILDAGENGTSGANETFGAGGAGKQPSGAGEQLTGAGKQPTGAGEQPTGFGEQPAKSGKQPTGAGKQPTGAGDQLIGTGTAGEPIAGIKDMRIAEESLTAEPLPETAVAATRHLRRWLFAATACSIVAIAAIWIYQPRTKAAIEFDKDNEVATSMSKSRITLPDGSIVILNRQSKITYSKDFGVRKRDIRLRGEAYFDVAKNPDVPLMVTAGPVRIRVMGTAFNVRAYAEDTAVETSLIRGSIEVSSTDAPDRTIRIRPNEKILIGKGTLVNELPNTSHTPATPRHTIPLMIMNKLEPNPIDSSINEIVWVQDKLVFSKEPFYSVAKKMERWFQIKVTFKDRISEQLSLTGSLEKENLPEALDALQQLTPFNYVIKDGIVIISNKTNPIK